MYKQTFWFWEDCYIVEASYKKKDCYIVFFYLFEKDIYTTSPIKNDIPFIQKEDMFEWLT